MSRDERFELLKKLIAKPVFSDGMKPLSQSALVKVDVDGESFFLRKDEGPVVLETSIDSPNLTFRIPEPSLRALVEDTPSDIATMGIRICKLLIEPNSNLRASVGVHAGLFELMRLGYLSVLASGGPSLITFLAAHGMSGIGKIKQVITSLREKDGKR